jgi:probable addiction module antidote protein
MILKDFDETFDFQFRDPEFASIYLRISLEEDRQEGFVSALRDVVRANGGVAKIANEAGLNRESLYRSLSKDGNPQFSTILAVLKALGLQISVCQLSERKELAGTPS